MTKTKSLIAALFLSLLGFAGGVGLAMRTPRAASPVHVESSIIAFHDASHMVAASHAIVVATLQGSEQETIILADGRRRLDQVQRFAVIETLRGATGSEVAVRSTISTELATVDGTQLLEFEPPVAEESGQYVLFLRVDDRITVLSLDTVRALAGEPVPSQPPSSVADAPGEPSEQNRRGLALDTLKAELPAIRSDEQFRERIVALGLDRTALADDPFCLKVQAIVWEMSDFRPDLACNG